MQYPNNTGLKRGLSRSLLAVILGTITGSAVAANVPADAVLADKQEIVRHIKDEPASLDPIKAVGLPEAQVSRDLFEGLLNQDAQGRAIPGVALRWQTNDNRTFLFTLRDDRMAIR